jgi:outer membrane protein assembly factor BamD (BamD/ComL family)
MDNMFADSSKREGIMSVTAIGGGLSSALLSQSIQNRIQQFQHGFQQLGQDLQAGNLSAAQSDFTALQQAGNSNSSSQTQRNNPALQDFQKLGQDLQSGNLSAAQQDFSNILQDSQTSTAQAPRHHHHHHADSGGNAISQLFGQLGQSLQSGDLASAQQAYSALQQDFQQLGQGTGQAPSSVTPSVSISV